MITTTLNDLLEGKLAGHDMSEYWLYVVRDAEENVTLYVGQSHHPVNRLFNHLRTGTPLGSLISEYESEARRWQVMLLTFEDCLQWESVRKSIAIQRISWVDAAERELISFHRPCLNITHNPQPAPLPAKYTRSREDLEQLGMELIEVTKDDHPVFVQTLWQALLAGNSDVNAKDQDGKTALMWAAFAGCTKIVRLLLAKGADVNVQDKDGKRALMWAETQGHSEIVELLKQAGVSFSSRGGEKRGEDGRRKLEQPGSVGGADVNARDDDGQTILIFEALRGHTNTVRTLLVRGADVNAKDKEGMTALIKAAMGGYTDTVQALLQGGADVNAKDKEGKTALIWAEFGDYTDTVQALLQGGADINAKDKRGETALMQAAYKRHTDIVRVLLQGGADVNATSNTNSTALINAVLSHHIETIRVLLEAGADVNIKEYEGDMTGLQWAEFRGYPEIIESLKQARAKE